VEQATALGARLSSTPINRVLVSPLQRAVRTAELVAGERDIPLERREELLELDVGVTEGLPFSEIRERFGDFLAHWQGEECASTRMPGGESLDDVGQRVAPLVEEIRGSTEEGLAVVSHNFVLRVMLCELLGVPHRQFRAMPLGLASLSTVLIERGRVNIRCLNDRCHLEHA
jgi:broad specificity phosphatase PhoE